MLYTNVVLEFSKNSKMEKVLELSNTYGFFVSLKTQENMNEQIKFLAPKFHRLITLKEVDGKLNVFNEKDDDIYIILDLYDYKNFKENAALSEAEKNHFKILKNFSHHNRNNDCKWNTVILKYTGKKEDLSILRYKTTGGKINYIVVEPETNKLKNYSKAGFNKAKLRFPKHANPLIKY